MLDHFLDNYGAYEAALAQLQLIFFMFGMGATLTAADFAAVARQPRSLLLGGAAQFLLTPLVAVGLNHLFLRELPGLAVGLVLVSLMPGGTLSKAFALLGRGNLALSVSLTICGTFATLVTVPVMLPLLTGDYIPGFEMPTLEIVRDICLYMLSPVAAGMIAGRLAPARRFTVARWSVRLGWVVVILVLVGSLGSGRIDVRKYGWSGPLAIILFCLLSQQLSMLPFRLLRWPRQDTLSVGMEATMRNINLAILLHSTIFAGATGALLEIGDGVFFTLLYFAGTAFFFGLPLALRFRRKARREARLLDDRRGDVGTVGVDVQAPRPRDDD